MPRTYINYRILGSGNTVNKTSSRGLFSLQDVYTETTVDNFPLGPLNTIPINYLVQGGGGGGNIGVSGSHFGSGGAAGIQRNGNTSISLGSTFTVTIGSGGTQATNGSSSIFSTTTATGGEGPLTTNRDGGRNDDFLGGIWLSSVASGGGAGAGGAGGLAGGGASASVGGNGVTWWVDGVTRGGGGSSSGATAGSGGGGVGSASGLGGNGTTNTGSGGGGSITSGGAGGSGGSGIVVVRYPDTFSNLTSIGFGLTYSWSNTGGLFKTYTFTSGTGTISW